MEAALVRVFEPDDGPAVTYLWANVFADDPPWNEPSRVIANKLTTQPELFFVAFVEAQLAGTVLAGFDGVRGWVHHLAVHPDYQRRGIATHLMAVAEKALRQRGCPKLNLQVRSGNAAVISFYHALGFDVEERVSMGKRLD